MVNRRWIVVPTMILLAATVCAGASRAGEPDGDGFVTLINGNDLTGWQTRGDWSVAESGELVLKPRPGKRGFFAYKLYLWTKKTYADFVLDLEYKIPSGGNSGVFVRASFPRSYMEVQICDSHGKKGPLGDHDCGAAVDFASPTKNMAKPAGQWNRMIITCRGNQVQVQLNGEQIVDLDISKSSTSRKPRSGNIGLQDQGFPVRFRNIRIKELN